LKAACTRRRCRCLDVAETFVCEQELAGKLASPPGQAIYARRRELVEPVFGNLKFNFGFTRFSLRGLGQVRGEFLLLCIAHNLKKLAQWSDCRPMEKAFSATIRFIIAYFQSYPAYFRNPRLVLTFINSHNIV
ncbi:MAG: transposase, partial [candidate division Zixibacteria bacterium]|nr:transposase [candidate division Zixibacteria bacterium]